MQQTSKQTTKQYETAETLIYTYNSNNSKMTKICTATSNLLNQAVNNVLGGAVFSTRICSRLSVRE